MKVGIIGTGWYGCYIGEYLLDNYKNIKLCFIEKNNQIFKGSSSYNQNRLHLGFHYPRCNVTKTKCEKYYFLFEKKYKNIITNINKNYYCISNDSNISFENYVKQYKNYEIIENDFLKNIQQNKLINTSEKFIDFKKAKKYFEEKFKNKVEFIFNYNVNTIKNQNNSVLINDELCFDKVFNCTYNQIKTFDNVIFEKCLTLLYKKIDHIPFDCLTIMDGEYSSIYWYQNNIYTLTNVKYTPLIKSTKFSEVIKFNNFNLNNKIKLFENEISKFYKNFNEKFKYNSYYISYKCKENTVKDTRDLNIKINKNIFNVFCGKISLIFDLNNYINQFLVNNEKST
jgi:hypothetical protein